MTLLLDLQEKLRDTGAAISQHEKALGASRSPSLAASLRSLQKRLAHLEDEFTQRAAQLGVDVCSYRLFQENESSSMPAVAVFSAVETFQNAFSVVYDAIRRGPRAKAALTSDIKKDSEFQFGYAFSGSVGIVMTLNNQQLMMETALDQSMEAMFEVAQAQTTDDVVAKSRTLGAAVVKALHRWASNHVNASLGVDIKWIRGQTEKARLVLQVPELKVLTASLAEATEDVEDSVTLRGILVGTETETSHKFHFKTADGEDLRGYYSQQAISANNPASTPAQYDATFNRRFKKVMATDEEVSVTHTLVKLVRV